MSGTTHESVGISEMLFGSALFLQADVYEPNHRESFWGSNYERLATIKKNVDPENMFTVWQGVGWESQEFDRCVYKELRPDGVDLQ